MDEDTEARVASILGRHAQNLENAAARLRSYLEYTCRRLMESGDDFRYRFVDESRVKKPPEVTRALHEQRLPVDDVLIVDDLIGTRVVVVSPSDMRTLAGYIQNDAQCAVEGLEVIPITDDSGYRATHIKGRIKCGSTRVGCEIQIRTALADAWAVVSRADLYRREDLREILPKLAQIEARALSAADDALELIRQEANRPRPPEPLVVEPKRNKVS